MSLSLLALLAVILGGLTVLVILFCLLACSARSEAYHENLAEMGQEEPRCEDASPLAGTVQTNEALEEIIRLAQRPRPGLLH